MPRKRGRPRKKNLQAELPLIKRPRGRPRKEDTPEKATIKRPRGRPKKEISILDVPTVKRPRGRPRKIILNNQETPLEIPSSKSIFYEDIISS